MISVGYSNRTPWDSPRELPEDELATYIAGQAEAAGSTAVRDALAKYQPMLSLHGHIHESRGEASVPVLSSLIAT
jgi:Icc-related predicted phosphoesterase